jgi:Fe-S oxidoreductase/FAD/FMN-containing dehydrogenase
MLANNSAGARSLIFGSMRDHIIEVKLALEGGENVFCGPLSDEAYKHKLHLDNREGYIYKQIDGILKNFAADIDKHTPQIPRHVSGYNVKGLLHDPHHNLSKLIAGSEGTLGIATEMKLRIVKNLRYTGLCLILIDDLIPALRHIPSLLNFHPIALEMIDNNILSMAYKSPAMPKNIEWADKDTKAIFIAEFEGATTAEVAEKLKNFANAAKDAHVGYREIILTEKNAMATVWDVRKAGLGLLLSKRSYSRAIAFVEDISIAPENLADFLEEFTAYLKQQGKNAGIYGHIGSGCMHIRPYIDLRDPNEVKLIKQMMSDAAAIVQKYKGAMSGEHGDGLLRSWLNETMFGKNLYQAFCDVKATFDPNNLMNPGKIVHGKPVLENLRLNPSTPQIEVKTTLDFSEEGGFELAVDLCNGNGQCRKSEGVMCPSFQVTGDEYDSTRARAQSLRALIHGKFDKDQWGGKEINDILDLCIECKGCKRECPSQVDMAKMKSEFLYAYQTKHGFSLRNRLFANVASLNYFGSFWPAATNFIAGLKAGSFLKKWLGITDKRPLPELAPKTFTEWFASWQQKPSDKTVVLFVDTYTQYNEPFIGKAACSIFAALGLHVEIVSDICCGRPMISKGFLTDAKKHAQKLVAKLLPWASKEIPIVLLEPSCASALKDDYKGVLGSHDEALRIVSKQSYSLEEFLCLYIKDGILPLNFVPKEKKVFLHTHCHQKALVGSQATLKVLHAIPGLHVEEIPSGCCGMAGSFGYEKEHYDFSMKIGELKLFPAVRQAGMDSTIVASGISCRTQILQGTEHRALHLAELLGSGLIV